MISQRRLIYILYTSKVPDAVNHFLVFVLEKNKSPDRSGGGLDFNHALIKRAEEYLGYWDYDYEIQHKESN